MAQQNQSTKRDVYEYLYNNGKKSKQDIETALSLSAPTVGAALKSLKEDNLIKDDELQDSTGGRKAHNFRISVEAKLALGLEITANHISLVLIDMKAHILHSDRIRLRFEDTEEFYTKVGEYLENFVAESKTDTSKILGLGVCLAALIDADNKTIHCAKQMHAPKDLYDKLAAHISYPFLMFNDAYAGGFSEFWNLGKDSTIVYLSLSNNISGAMVSRRKLYLGDNMKACKFGHMTLVPDGKLCYCGEKGCVNAYLNASLLSDMAGGKMDDFFAHVENGDEPYRTTFREYRRYLSIVVNNLRMQYDCDVVLGGYVGSRMEPFMESFREQVQERNRFREDGSFIRVCRHRYETAAIGSALYYIDHFIRSL